MTFLLWPHLRGQPRMTFVGMSRRYGKVDIFGCDFKAAQQVEEGPFCSFARSLSDSVSSSPRRRKRVGDQNNGERTPSAESLRSSSAHSVSLKRKRNLDFGERETRDSYVKGKLESPPKSPDGHGMAWKL